MRSRLLATISLALCASALSAQSSPSQKPASLQAELTAPLHVRNLETGAKVLARVTVDWTGPDCTLRTGSILEAKVVEAETHKGRSASKLALAFNRAQCGGPDLKPMNLVLAAISRPPEDWGQMSDTQFKMQVQFMEPVGAIGVSDAGVGNFSASHMVFQGILHKFPMNGLIYPGDVINLKDLKLDPGSGPNGTSTLSARNRDVNLPIYTQLLLVPATLVSVPSSALVASAGPPPALGGRSPLDPVAPDPPSPLPPPAPPPPPANDLAVCAPPGCAVDLPVTPKELEGQSASSIATRPLGYTPRSRRGLEQFGDEESLAWLGPLQLLFAFNPHPLID